MDIMKYTQPLHHIHLFYKKHFIIRTRHSFLLKIKEHVKNNFSLSRRTMIRIFNLRANIYNLKSEQNSSCRIISKLHFCILLHAFSRTIAAALTQTKTS